MELEHPWGKPIYLQDILVNPDYRYLDIPDKRYAYQEPLPLTPQYSRQTNLSIKIPGSAAAMRSILEDHKESMTNPTRSSVKRTNTNVRKVMREDYTISAPEENFIDKIRKKSTFHSRKNSPYGLIRH